MTDDRKQELERLEKELLADIAEKDDLLADIPPELLDDTPGTWEERPEETPAVSAEEKKMPAQRSKKKTKADKKKEDRVLITLMAIASFLCLGIIAILIYWLEVFFT